MNYEVSKGQKFKHYKGNIYTVIALATHTEKQEGLVIYSDKDNHIWARPIEMFFGHLDSGVKRFTLIEED